MKPPVDTLGRWMAHYIAELIDAVENVPPDERAASKKRCFDAILELWSYRAELPNGKRPFEDLEPIIRALEGLDPDDEKPRYFRSVRSAIVETDEEPQTRPLIEFVCSIDSTARILIGDALAEAARSSIDKSKEWVALLEKAEIDVGVIDSVIQFVLSKADKEMKPDLNGLERELLQNRIKRLEIFTTMATTVRDSLRTRLETLPSPQESFPNRLNDPP